MSKYAGLFERDNGVGEEVPVKPAKVRLRRRGKRSNPDFEQVTAYVRKETYGRTKAILMERNEEFSDLVEMLLAQYVKRQGGQ